MDRPALSKMLSMKRKNLRDKKAKNTGEFSHSERMSKKINEVRYFDRKIKSHKLSHI